MRDGAAELFVTEKGAHIVTAGVLTHGLVELKFVDERLEWADIRSAGRRYKKLWVLLACFKPLILVSTKFVCLKLATPRMLVVIAMDLSMALEANGDCILYIIRPLGTLRDDVIGLDLHAAEAMADTATPMDLD